MAGRSSAARGRPVELLTLYRPQLVVARLIRCRSVRPKPLFTIQLEAAPAILRSRSNMVRPETIRHFRNETDERPRTVETSRSIFQYKLGMESVSTRLSHGLYVVACIESHHGNPATCGRS